MDWNNRFMSYWTMGGENAPQAAKKKVDYSTAKPKKIELNDGFMSYQTIVGRACTYNSL